MTAEITEIVQLDATRVDAVKNPANGFPILMMKALDAPGETEKTPNGAVKESMSENTETSTPVEGGEVEEEPTSTTDVNELVKSAVAEVSKSYEKRIEALEGKLAKVLETPIPGGPAMTAPAHMRDQANKAEKLAEAARYNDLAEKVADPDLKRYYKERADVAKSAA